METLAKVHLNAESQEVLCWQMLTVHSACHRRRLSIVHSSYLFPPKYTRCCCDLLLSQKTTSLHIILQFSIYKTLKRM